MSRKLRYFNHSISNERGRLSLGTSHQISIKEKNSDGNFFFTERFKVLIKYFPDFPSKKFANSEIAAQINLCKVGNKNVS